MRQEVLKLTKHTMIYGTGIVISTAAIMMIIVASVTSTLGIIFADKLSRLVFSQVDNAYYFQLLFLINFLQSSVVVISFMFIRAMQKSKLFVLINLIKLVIQVSLNVYFLVILGMGISGILYSTLLSDLIIGLYLSIY